MITDTYHYNGEPQGDTCINIYIDTDLKPIQQPVKHA